jgi:hypothetical protein
MSGTLLPRIELGSIQDVAVSRGYFCADHEKPMIGGMAITLSLNALPPIAFCLDGFQLRKLHAELCREFQAITGRELTGVADWDTVELK